MAYSLRKNNKEGKNIQKMFNELPRVSKKELNELCGVQEVFNTPGFSFESDDYFAYCIGKKFKFEKPKDAIEITMTEYNELGGI